MTVLKCPQCRCIRHKPKDSVILICKCCIVEMGEVDGRS